MLPLLYMGLSGLRSALAYPRVSLQHCLLGIVGGSCAAVLIILFRLSYESLQQLYLQDADDFTSLDPFLRLGLPLLAVSVILFVAYLTGFKHYRMGVPFVLHRLRSHYGHIPLRNTLNQFVGSVMALASGFVVGREGPSIHLGAAGSSFFGQWLHLPYNSIRILAGCGMAAGISASFNTPFAAVIFVMEVVFREYKVHIFIPVMLAAACGSFLTRLVFGSDNELAFLEFVYIAPTMYLYLVPMGIVLGILAKLINFHLLRVMQWSEKASMSRRLAVAAAVTGVIGFIFPQAMGAGLAPLGNVLATDPGFYLLFALLAAKVLLAWFALGLGIPGGVIGPIFCAGILTGVLFLSALGWLIGDTSQFTSGFALLGMAGLFAAVLNAPLAALTAVLELSYHPEVILPAMVVIVTALVTSSQFFHNRSLFLMQLDYQGLPYSRSAILETLQRTGVLALMQRDLVVLRDASQAQIRRQLNQDRARLLLLESRFELDAHYDWIEPGPPDSQTFIRHTLQSVSCQATLAEVYQLLQQSRQGAVYVDDNGSLLGVITWAQLRDYLHAVQLD